MGICCSGSSSDSEKNKYKDIQGVMNYQGEDLKNKEKLEYGIKSIDEWIFTNPTHEERKKVEKKREELDHALIALKTNSRITGEVYLVDKDSY